MILDLKFNCNGPVSSHKQAFKSFLGQINDEKFTKNQQIALFQQNIMQDDLCSNQFLFDLCRKSFMILHYGSLERGLRVTDNHLKDVRRDITLFMNSILLLLRTNEMNPDITLDLAGIQTHLQRLRLIFHKLSLAKLPEHTIAFYASTMGSDLANPAVHLVHCHLDFRWIYINIIRSLEKLHAAQGGFSQVTQGTASALCTEEEIMHLMNELVWLAIVRYEKGDKHELASHSAFSCTCVKELWLLLMHYKYTTQDFWSYLEQILRVVLETKTHPVNISFNSQKVEPLDYLPCSNRNEFGLWFLADMTRLLQYDSEGNHVGYRRLEPGQLSIVDDILKNLLSEELSESSMRNVLPLIAKVMAVFDHSKSGPILLLADFFFKKINTMYYIPGSKINTNVVLSKSSISLLNEVKSILDGFGRDKRENSYFMFLRLLGEHLKSNIRHDVSSSRLCSRVFLKFPSSRPEKYTEFLESGVCHLTMLFLVLALGSKTPNIAHRLVELLSSIPKTNGMKDLKHEMIWKSYGASLLVLAELRADISEASTLILNHLDWCLSQPCLTPLTHFLDALTLLFGQDVVAIKGVHILLGQWINNYFQVCRKHDVSRIQKVFLPLLHNVLDALGTSESQSLKVKIEQFIIPMLTREESETSAELASLCALVSSKYRAELFRHWSEHDDCVLAGKFLVTILNRKKEEAATLFPNLERCVQQVWVRCCFLWNDQISINELSRCISKMPQAAKIKMDLAGPSPFKSFAEVFNFEYSACQTLSDKSSLRAFFFSFFVKFDKMIVSKCEVLDQLDMDILKTFYGNCSELVAQCSHLIYSKSDPHCILKVVLDSLLLPRIVYKAGHKWPQHIFSVISLALPRFMEGLYTLNPDSDPYISRVLRDILIIYMPRLQHMPVETSPVTILLSEQNTVRPTLSIFLQMLLSKDSAHSSIATVIFKMLGDLMTSKPDLSSEIFNATADALIRHMVTVESTQLWQTYAINYFSKALHSSRNRQRMASLLLAACKRFIAAYTNAWFYVARKIAPLCRAELADIVPDVTEQILLLEKQRCVENDPTLRQLLETLKIAAAL